jgi:S-(hydroxymethyl)glutathione dehydrogenase/alcohol dehydrogenase
VVLGFIPSCGRCPSCARGRQNLCDLGAFLLGGRQVTDFTARHHAQNGQDLGIMCCIGTFGQYTVCSEASCIKIEPDIPLDKAALVGCGVTTGWGSSVYAAQVAQGESVVIVGCGGVGMNAIQGAALSGARHIVAVDPLAALVMDLTWGAMADKVVVTMGLMDGMLLESIMTMCAKGGRVVQTAVGPMNSNDVSLKARSSVRPTPAGTFPASCASTRRASSSWTSW